MATRKKKPHWDAQRLADLEAGKVHVPQAMPERVLTTPSTGLEFSPRFDLLAGLVDDQRRLFEDTAKLAASTRLEAIERAVTGWAEQLGVTIEEWLKVYGYTVETKYEGLAVTFTVKPMLGYPGQEVVFPQPGLSSTDKP